MSRKRQLWRKKLKQVTQEPCAGGTACKHTPLTRFGHRYQYIPEIKVAELALNSVFPANMSKKKRILIVGQFRGR